MTSPAVGFANRNLAGPIGAGQRGRFSVPTRFLPLSQFFLQHGKGPEDGKVLYGRQEPSKARGSKGSKKSAKAPDAPTATQEQPNKKKPEDEEAQEGITTTANVPTVPVPIGAGDGRKFLDRPGDKKKKRKKDLPARMGLLLRQLF